MSKPSIYRLFWHSRSINNWVIASQVAHYVCLFDFPWILAIHINATSNACAYPVRWFHVAVCCFALALGYVVMCACMRAWVCVCVDSTHTRLSCLTTIDSLMAGRHSLPSPLVFLILFGAAIVNEHRDRLTFHVYFNSSRNQYFLVAVCMGPP